ncbi:MAG: cytochrome oxidase Cu insertion factor (SCO1/SenC/PrrC family) [Arenicella sp.]|jgi:cytochrome oxidase Cu insertion factor (SCO1/SenC/PrrC family)
MTIITSGIKTGLIALFVLLLSVISGVTKAEFRFDSLPWNNDQGEQIFPNSITGELRVVSLFYTDCPNTCNLTIEKFKQLEKVLHSRDISANFILMSLDPKDDTPSALNAYRIERGLVKNNWYFLSSTEQQVGAVAKRLGYQFTRLDDHVFHRMKIFIVDSEDSIVDVVKMGTDIELLSILSERK